MEVNKIYCGDSLEILKTFPDESVDCVITSPPYWGLRDYNVAGQLGLEKTPEEYVAKMTEVFREVKRVLKKEGTLWLNLGDSYWGSGCGPSGNFGVPDDARVNNSKGKKYPKRDDLKSKDLIGIPWMVAFALRKDGWYLRQDIIWAKPNPMPESVQDRFCKSHEYVFLLSKSPRYYFDLESVKEPTVDNTKSHEYNERYEQETLRPEIQSFGERASNSSEVLLFQEGAVGKESISEEIQNDRRTATAVSPIGSQTRKGSEIQSTAETLRPKRERKKGEGGEGQDVGENREGKICETENRNQAEISDSDNGLSINKERVGSNQEEIQSSVRLLPQKTDKIGNGTQDALIAGREAHGGEHSPSLSELQRTKGKSHKSAVTPGQTAHTKALKRMAGEKDPIYTTRNKHSVWTVTTKPFKEAHFATFPEDLIVPMVLAGCPPKGIVLDPFMGAGTTALIGQKLGRNFVGIELNPDYIKLAQKRLAQKNLL